MKKKIGLLLLFIVIACLAGFGVYSWNYYSQYIDVDTIYPGITIQGMDVGGLHLEEAEQKVEDYLEKLSEKTVTLQVEGKEKTFSFRQMGLTCVNPDAAKEAEKFGRDGNLIERILEVQTIAVRGKNIPLQFSVDEEKAEKIVKKKGKSFQTEKKDAKLTRKDGAFVIEKEVNGISIDFAANAEKLVQIIENEDWDQQDIQFSMEYKTDPAKHTTKELEVVQDELGTFTTSYAGSSEGRCINVENGAKLINGTLLYPGESMSVYDKVSPFTADNGYRLAGSYENGTTVQTYGGGICQVSTTLYNAVLRAELEITERQNHSMTVSYVDLSEDAAIAGTEKDLKFKNNLENPIYIEGSTSGNTITFTIYGKEYRDKDRSISFVSETTSTRPPSEKKVKDSSLEEGKTEVESSGRTGYTAKLWKVIYQNGKEQERVQVNSSSYMSVPKVVRVGTKKPASNDNEKKSEKKKDKNTKKDTKQTNSNNNKKTGKKK